MDRVFADTGYWVALLSPRDELHSKAVSFARQFEAAEIVTSELVLVEFLNTFSDRGPHLRTAAAGLVISAQSSPRVRVIPQAADLFGRALIRYQEMQDKIRAGASPIVQVF
jgi:predicted nucleic acid-binding protein